MRLKRFVSTVALSCAALYSTAARAEWLEAKTQHFTIYGDMTQDKLQRFAKKIQAFDAAMRIFVKAGDDLAPLTIFVVRDMASVQKLYGGSGGNVGGFYRASAQSAIAIVPETLGNSLTMYSEFRTEPEEVLLHEYGHHMLLANADQFYPGWLSEGMAELFSTPSFKADGSVTFGAPSKGRIPSLNSMSRFTAKQLLESDTRELKGDEGIERYSRGWLMTHYLLVSGNRPGQIEKYIAAVNAGMPVPQAGQEAFGDLNKLNSELERYMKQSLRTFTLTSAELAKTDGDIKIRMLSPAEAAIMPIYLVTANGVDEKAAPRVVAMARQVAARFPEDAWVQRCLTEAEYDAVATLQDKKAANWDMAEAAADRTLAIDPQNVMAMVYKGRVIAQRALATKDAQKWKEARTWFLKANKADPNYALPFTLYYDSFGAAGEAPNEGAINGLLRAVVLAPQDDSLRVRAGYALIQQGDMQAARRIVAGAAFNPHANGKGPGVKIIELIDAKAQQADIIVQAKKDKFDWMNEFLETPDEKEKREKGEEG